MIASLVAFTGVAGSGKDTAAQYLMKHHGYEKLAFADTLKDVVATMFSWPRELLEGDTEESREFRETEDTNWSDMLKIGAITPRRILQEFGTELFRNHFHPDIWVKCAIQKLYKTYYENPFKKIVITDLRFPNEADAIKHQFGGEIYRIHRGNLPDWWPVAALSPNQMPTFFPKVHYSEYALAATRMQIIQNDGSISDLEDKLLKMIQS